MNTNSNYYVPCLRWKQGEYLALSKLSSSTKDILKPLIEIPEIGYDFEKQSDSKTIDEHLSKMAHRVKTNWGHRSCFLDIRLIESSERMNTGRHPLTFVFDEFRAKDILATPVIDLRQDFDCQNAISETVAVDKRGVCARINVEEAARGDFKDFLDGLLEKYNASPDVCDFVLDLRSPNFDPIDGFVNLLTGIINRLPYLDEWRSFILISTSFPRSMGEVPRGLSKRPRKEWLLYTLLIQSLKDAGTRIPSFGDYGISHPDVVSLDMRIVKPSASVRYTIDNAYLINKGLNVRDNGFAQYHRLCQQIVESKHYCGEAYSEGDKYIKGCAQGIASTGRLTTWRWVGTNHHLEKVATDIANLPVS